MNQPCVTSYLFNPKVPDKKRTYLAPQMEDPFVVPKLFPKLLRNELAKLRISHYKEH